MKKVFIEGIALAAIFFGAWFGLSRIDWVSMFNIEQSTKNIEEKLGEMYWDVYKKDEITTPSVNKAVDSIVTKICKKNRIDRDLITLHILDDEDVNAFALPNNHLVVLSGLIVAADSQEELSGVLCHEIAHIELHHIMKKLIKEMGFATLVSMTTGGKSPEMIASTAKMLSSLAFDRSLEKEADMKAVDYLLKAKISPEPFAKFFNKLSEKQGTGVKYLSWLTTHPYSKERSEYILEYYKNKTIQNEPIIAPETWAKLQEVLSN
ncbi:MAG: M48 family metallopeptidase [Candidatus Kapaibacteriota bacterium]